MSLRASSLLLFVASACVPTPTPAPPVDEIAPTVEPAEPEVIDVAALGRARAAMKTLGTTLKGELVSTMKKDGPVAALQVCSGQAESMTAAVGEAAGVTVGRSSLRLRNPQNAGPVWVKDWLKEQGERKAKGVEGQVTTAALLGDRQMVRVVAPLAVEPPCLVCHGSPSGRAKSLREAITERYPDDKANGYAQGDLRGAIWAEVEVVETGFTIELNEGAKWALDESTRSTLGEIRTALAGPAPADVPAAHALAATIDDSVSRMVKGCEMTGASHDQLHNYLQALFPAVASLKTATELDAAKQVRTRLQAQLALADASFE